MKEWIVYALIDAYGAVFYVGASYKPKRRLKEHRATFGKHIEMKVLESGFRSAPECGDAERRYIAAFRSRGIDLKNVSDGGFVGRVHRESTRSKLSKIVTGRRVTWGHKISAALKGKPHEWTPEGAAASAKTRFKKGQPHHSEEKRKENQRKYLTQRSPEKRSSASVRANCNWWANATPEQRQERTRRMTAARDSSKISARMKVVAANRVADPEARKAFGQRIKNFWSTMTPEQRAGYLKRRGEAIAAAKAAKKK